MPKTTAQGDRLIREKRDAKPQHLCRDLPEEFEEFLRYCRRLKFAERPDYELWRRNFADLAASRGWTDVMDERFYWPPRPEKVRVIVCYIALDSHLCFLGRYSANGGSTATKGSKSEKGAGNAS